MKKYYLALLLTLSSFLFVYCKQSTHNTDSVLNSVKSNSGQISEEATYKMLYENQVRANESILNTIYYALSGLAAAVLLVFASNWWFNDKKVKDIINEIEDKSQSVKSGILIEVSEKMATLSNLKNEEINVIINKLREDVSESIANQTNNFNVLSDKIRDEIKLENKELLINYQKQLDAFSNTFGQQLSFLNEKINTSSNQLIDKINNKEELLKKIIDNEKESLLSELKITKGKILRNEAWMWEGRDVPVNALRAQLEELDFRLEQKLDLNFYLDMILRTSKKLTWLTSYDKEEIKKALNKLPSEYRTKIDDILLITDNVKDL